MSLLINWRLDLLFTFVMTRTSKKLIRPDSDTRLLGFLFIILSVLIVIYV